MTPKKQPAEPVRKSNKFRLVVFEGDLSDGSISELAQALTTALKPTAPPIIRHLPNGKAAAQLLAPDSEEEMQYEDEEQMIDGEGSNDTEEIPAPAKSAKTPRTKKPPKPPTYLPDLITDMTAFKEFAKQKAPKSKSQQYLVAAFWLKKFGSVENVNADMIYTCYKSAPWPAGFNDWNQTFHNLVHDDLQLTRQVNTL
jgi:hypothetical protein